MAARTPPPPDHRRKVAARIALAYASAATAWIVGSDLLVAAVTRDWTAAPLSIGKGLLFTAVTAGLVYVLVARALTTVEGLMFDAVRRAESRRLESFGTAAVFLIAAALSFVVVAVLFSLDLDAGKANPLDHVMRVPAWTGALAVFLFAAALALAVAWRLRLRDLLKRAAAEGAEREVLDEHLDFLSRYANDAILLLDHDGRIVEANERAFERYGYPREELIGMSAERLRAPEDRNEFRTRMGEIEAHGGRIFEARHVTRDGRALTVEVSGRVIPADGGAYVQAIIRDISKRKQVQAELEFKNAILSTQQENSLDAILVVDGEQKIISYNQRFVDLWQVPETLVKAGPDDPVLRSVIDQIKSPQSFLEKIKYLYEHRKERSDDEIELKDGRILHRHSAPMIGVDGGYLGRVWYFRDITERRSAEKILRQSEERFRRYFELGLIGMAITEPGKGWVEVNDSLCQMLGYGRSELLATDWAKLTHPDDLAADVERFNRVLAGEMDGYSIEKRWIRKDGGIVYSIISVKCIRRDDRSVDYFVALALDITERKRAEEDLLASREMLHSVVENTPIRVFWKDLELRYLGSNSAFARDAGLSNSGELVGKDDFQMAWRAQAEKYRADDRHVIDTDTPSLDLEEPQTTPDGRTIRLRTSKVPLHAADGKVIGVLGIYDDVTAQRKAEDALRESEERFRAMIEQSISGACIIDGRGLFVYVNPRLVAILGYASYAELTGRPVLEVVAPEHHELLRAQMAKRLKGEPRRARYHFDAIRKDGTRVTLGAHGNAGTYRGEPVLITTVQDVTELRRAEEEVERTVAKLKRAVKSTIEVVSTIGELRDPYTHGHEHRVGEIATAIAREMGLPEDRIEGIRVAGYMHDVGKIAVPAEILAKPSRLSPAEFALVKQHAQQSYDILKRVDFPWPVAEAAWSHHERLDGSGYPRGLKGDQIILEARILAVADTVEAMASHRPYRPGLGIEKALAEVDRCRGTMYDPAVVDACLRLFRQEGYAIPA